MRANDRESSSDASVDEPHIALGPESNRGRVSVTVHFERDALALSQILKERTIESVASQEILAAVNIANHDAFAAEWVERTNDALHYALFVTLPAFRQPVQTKTRFGVPLTIARTF